MDEIKMHRHDLYYDYEFRIKSLEFTYSNRTNCKRRRFDNSSGHLPSPYSHHILNPIHAKCDVNYGLNKENPFSYMTIEFGHNRFTPRLHIIPHILGTDSYEEKYIERVTSDMRFKQQYLLENLTGSCGNRLGVSYMKELPDVIRLSPTSCNNKLYWMFPPRGIGEKERWDHDRMYDDSDAYLFRTCRGTEINADNSLNCYRLTKRMVQNYCYRVRGGADLDWRGPSKHKIFRI